MMRRAVAAPTRRVGLAAAALTAAPAMQGRTNYYPLATTPLGQGKVMPLRFDQPKPVYIPMNYNKMFMLFFWWIQHSLAGSMFTALLLVFTAHGGWQGYLPPEPHSQWG